MKLRNVVNTRNHGYVAIDTCYTFDHGFETMVFKCDKNGNIIDWSELDVDMYDNAEKAEEGHKEMIEKWKTNKRGKIMGKVRQRLGKAYIHTKEESIQSIIIDALVDHGYGVDVEVTDNGTGNEIVSCEIYDVGGGAVRNDNNKRCCKSIKFNTNNSMLWNLFLFRPKKRLLSSY